MKKYIKNTLLSLSGKAIAMVALVLLDILLARKLTINVYAEWVFFFSIVTMLYFLGWLGINMSSKVIVSKSEEYEVGECIKAAFILRFFSSVIISILITAVMEVMCYRLGYPDRYPELKTLFSLSGFLIFLNTFIEFYKEIFMGLQQFKALFFLTVMEYTGYLMFAVVFLCVSKSVICVLYAYVCSGVVIFVYGLLYLYRRFGDKKQKKVNFDYKKKVFEIAKYAVPLMLVGIGAVVLIEIDTVMLGMLSVKSEAAIYNIAKGISAKATHVNYSIAVGVMSSFAIIEREKLSSKRADFCRIRNINFIITAAISFLLLFVAPALIKIMYGDQYEQSGTVIRVLVPYYALYAISIFYSTFLDFRGKAKERSISYVSIVLIDIIMNYVLIPRYGATGAAIATGVSLVPYTLIIIFMTYKEWNNLE